MPDQHERAEAHNLPAQDELDHVRRHDHDEHATREQRQCCKEVRVATIATDVVEAEDLHQERNERHKPEQQDRQAVNVRANAEFEARVLPPHPLADNGVDEGFGFSALGCTKCAPDATGHALRCFTAVVCGVGSLHPLDAGAGGNHE